MDYFSTFLTGFGNVVTKELKKQIPDAKIQLLLDGLVLYKTDQPVEKIVELPFLNNSFVVINYLKDGNIEELVEGMAIPDFVDKSQSFKIVYSRENQMEKMSGKVFDKLREEIGRKTHSSYSPQGREEFWVIERSEEFIFLGFRLKDGLKPLLERGQLKAELAYLMCLLSGPSGEDTFLDPFAGSGAIPIARLKFPFQKVLAGDKDGQLSEKLKVQSIEEKLPITVGKWDALNLESFEESSVDKIVTDPPWGLHLGKHLDLQSFYAKMLKEFFRVLKPKGIIVILISNKDLFEKLLREHSKMFELKEKYSTLVNGQKAAVFKIYRFPLSWE